MSFWAPSKPGVVFALVPLLLSLGACGNTRLFAPADDPRMAELVAGMDQCLRVQEQSSAQLDKQQAQLEQQQQALDVVARAVMPDEQEARGEGEATPVVIGDACPGSLDEPQESQTAGKLLVGELEEVWLENLQLALPARIDTGAETASLDARNIEVFERDGRRWVRFEILHPVTGEPLPMERRLKRMVSIIQANSPDAERRAVIKLGITIGHISQTAEFTLSDRSHLDYQVLVGRNILQDVMVVDVSRKNIAPYQLPGGGAPSP